MAGQQETSREMEGRRVKGGSTAEMKRGEQVLSNINKKQEEVEGKVSEGTEAVVYSGKVQGAEKGIL